MANDPVYITFEFQGDLGKEVERVTLGIQGLRDESASTFKRLIADSNEAFNAMSAGNQRLAVSIQEDINSLRQLEAVNKALDDGFANGKITAEQYAESKAKLAIQEDDLRTGIEGNIKALRESIDQERMAEGSIESLYTQDKLTESAALLFERLKALKEEGEDVAQMIDDLNEQMRQDFTGTTTESIADSIIDGFSEGRRTAQEFADDFEGMMREAVLQGVKLRALEEPLRQWYEQFAEASANGLTEGGIASLREQYDKIIADAARQLEAMERITGISIAAEEAAAEEAGRTAVARGIASMSQETASELNGNFYALLIYADKTSQGVLSIRETLIEGLSLMERIARNTDRLEAIERDMASMRGGMQDIINRGILLRKTS